MLTSGKVSHMTSKAFPCKLNSLTPFALTFQFGLVTLRHMVVQKQARGLLSSAAYTEELQSKGSIETGDSVLCMPHSVKENNEPVKKEGSQNMTDLQSTYWMAACCADSVAQWFFIFGA